VSVLVECLSCVCVACVRECCVCVSVLVACVRVCVRVCVCSMNNLVVSGLKIEAF
jgi:hypothetical protein